MDLVSGIRKTGSRGGVNFNWEDVTTSAHRENYLGHSLKAPVGRWQKGRDLNWYAKADATDAASDETPEQQAARERKEELKKIKEAEEDALARALGLPVAPRNVTGANAVDVGGSRTQDNPTPEAVGSKLDDRPASKHHRDPERRHRRRHRSRSRSHSRSRSRDGDRRGHRHRDRERDRDRRRDGSPRGRYEDRRSRPVEYRDDRREYNKQRNHSRHRDTDKSERSYRTGRHRSCSIEGAEHKRSYRERHRSRSRDARGDGSPQRYRRNSHERD
ncbi:kinase phosphorylation protein-domain-containing protein [Xylaria bambusicola]|uniref:kinase phosphorylation protein-domain-containing protein n=1 Tax=Xylaria bambusicola TaxID=326684 RepID=UPI0020089EF4|nr:kinase phosphorylation protein-domain-containing protein [Xylaria bambusicola]KAI0517660.1 kinase phosphorylation protein-domain-containing protein [Xylaria bambusicola]